MNVPAPLAQPQAKIAVALKVEPLRTVVQTARNVVPENVSQTMPEIKHPVPEAQTVAAGYANIGIKTRTADRGLGAEIADVLLGSIADQAALQVGDVITAVDAKSIRNPTELTVALSTLPAGAKVKLSYRRRGYWQAETVVILPAQ